MVTDNFNIEFGYELIGIIPYAYWLHLQGDLEETVSSFDSSPLYYFSPKHTERKERRHSRRWKDFKYAYDNGNVHKKELDTSRWVPPPYKEHFGGASKYSEKPILVVCNKYNKEWKKEPVNYLDADTLRWIFKTLGDKYRIIYNRFTPDLGYDDTVDTLDLGEWDIVREHGISRLQDLYKGSSFSSYNDFQLWMYSFCDKFITVQGGTSILASYFGGDNIIFARKGMEIKNNTYSWYHLFGGSRIHHVDTYDDLKKRAKSVL